MFVSSSGKFAFLYFSTVCRLELVTTFLLFSTQKKFQVIVVPQASRKVDFILNSPLLRILEFGFQKCLIESSHIDEGTERGREIQ